MTATHYTGVHGALSIETGSTAISEFSIKIDRGVAAHSRCGKYSDFQAAGKLVVTGTINRMMINDAFLDYAYGAAGGVPSVVDLIGAVTSGSDSITITANNCVITSGEFKFTDADEIVSDPMTFTMGDPDADLTITLAP